MKLQTHPLMPPVLVRENPSGTTVAIGAIALLGLGAAAWWYTSGFGSVPTEEGKKVTEEVATRLAALPKVGSTVWATASDGWQYKGTVISGLKGGNLQIKFKEGSVEAVSPSKVKPA
jgi:hypothetical protein